MLNRLVLLGAALVMGAGASAYDLVLWRGETRAVILPDSVEASSVVREGYAFRLGALETVKYAPAPRSLQRLEVYDRVVWKGAAAGPRVLEVTVAPNAKAGVYTERDITLRILDRVLPPAKEWKYFLDLWQHPWSVARQAGVKPFSPEHYAAMRPLWELLAGAGQKALTVTLMDKPWNHQCYDAYHSMIGRTKKADGSWVFDYTFFDEYVAFGRSCGIGPDIACYTMCPWGYVCDYKTESGEVRKVVCKPNTPEFADYWGAFLVDFAAHLKAKGWFDDTNIAMDERSPEDVKFIADFIQQKAPGMRIAMAGNRKPSDFAGITIDNYSQGLREGMLTPEFMAELPARREKGYKTTFYVCCNPPRPNTFSSSGLGEAFWLGVYPAVAGFDGFLRWAYNSWPIDPTRDTSFDSEGRFWLAGDTFLVYPNAQPSWRFLDLRNGIVAAEKLNLLRENPRAAKAVEELSAAFDVNAALEGKVDFVGLAEKVQKVVNGEY